MVERFTLPSHRHNGNLSSRCHFLILISSLVHTQRWGQRSHFCPVNPSSFLFTEKKKWHYLSHISDSYKTFLRTQSIIILLQKKMALTKIVHKKCPVLWKSLRHGHSLMQVLLQVFILWILLDWDWTKTCHISKYSFFQKIISIWKMFLCR